MSLTGNDARAAAVAYLFQFVLQMHRGIALLSIVYNIYSSNE